MMSVNILNMRGSFNGVWASAMNHQQIVSSIVEKFKKEYRLGEDPNDVMSVIIDDMKVANELTDMDYNYINETASIWLKRRFG